LRPHGLKGMVIVQTYADVSRNFKAGTKVIVDPEIDNNVLTIKTVSDHSGSLKVGFEEITDRFAAEKIAKKKLAITSDQIERLPENEFYEYELIGCSVKTTNGAVHGIVEDIINNPGNDLLKIKKEEKHVLVPIVKALIEKIDTEKREIIIRDIEGLID